MTRHFPGIQFATQLQTDESADNTALASAPSTAIASDQYAAVYKLWVDLDVGSEADLEALPDSLAVSVTIGSTVWSTRVHPLVEHTDANSVVHRTVDLGPWAFTFPPDGLYSGVKGDDIAVAVGAAGAGIKSRAHYLYSN
jgi:hypothetical protein